MKQDFEWVQYKPGSWRLRNNAGVKVWLVAGLRDWIVYIGDENETRVTGLSKREVQRYTLNRLSRYIADFKNQLDSAIRTGELTEW